MLVLKLTSSRMLAGGRWRATGRGLLIATRPSLKVPPGAGSRPLQFVTYNNVCGYQVMPH